VDDRIFTCGSIHGVHGFDTQDPCYSPTEVKKLPRLGSITSVATGTHHVIVVFDYQHIVVWGCNRVGQLGLELDKFASIREPYLITADDYTFHRKKKIKHVACGATYTVFVTMNNEIWMTGSNSQGQLSLPLSVSNVYNPVRLQHPEFKDHEITSVSCGYFFTYIIVDRKRAYCFGENMCYQLGIGDTKARIYYPLELQSSVLEKKTIYAVHCGADYVILETSGGLVGVGSNVDNRLAYGDAYVFSVQTPSMLHSLKRTYDYQVFCGAFSRHTFFIREKKSPPNHFQRMLGNSLSLDVEIITN
jgi:alpha-tubulin suppressor-like RCC1 family protein